MTDTETEALMREILGPGWRAPHDEGLFAHLAAMREDDPTLAWIAKPGPFWQIVGTGPDGRMHSGADADGIKLAERMAGLAKPVNVMSMASLDEAAYGGGHEEEVIEDHGEAGGEAEPAEALDGSSESGTDPSGVDVFSDPAGSVGSVGEPTDDGESSLGIFNQPLGDSDETPDLGAELLDSAFLADIPALEGADATDAEFSEPEADGPAGQFIFGDGLYQMRVAAIGLVTVKAASLMPDVDLVRLSELRNFAMGVSEKRWDDDAAKREELDTLEATARLANAIAKARDDKAAYLLDATRDEVEAFDVEADWP